MYSTDVVILSARLRETMYDSADNGIMILWEDSLRRFVIIIGFLGIIAAVMLKIIPQQLTEAPYRITDLGTLGSTHSSAVDMNNHGQIVGRSNNPASEHIGNGTFLWANGKMSDISIAGYTNSRPIRINDLGQVIIEPYGKNGKYEITHFIWQNGAKSEVKSPDGNLIRPCAINNKGQIVGILGAYKGRSGFIIEKGTIRKLSVSKDMQAIPQDINDKGQIIIQSGSAESMRSFVLHNERQTELIADGFRKKLALRINNNGDIIGMLFKDDASAEKAVLWKDEKVILLGSLRGNKGWARAYDINNKGQVVGGSEINKLLAREEYDLTPMFPYVNHPFIWEDGRMQDLNDLIPRNSRWTLNVAVAINDKGQIVGSGVHNGKNHAYLLTPIDKTR